jgi:hypothetical protein
MTPRLKALENHQIFYHGKPCYKCGQTKRYVKYRRCVNCANVKSMKYHNANKQTISARRKSDYKRKKVEWLKNRVSEND